MYNITSQGYWSTEKQKKQLLLNSLIQSEDDIIVVDETQDVKLPLNVKRISIYDINNNPGFAYISVNPLSRDKLKFNNKDFVNKSVLLKEKFVREIALNYLDLGSRILFYKVKDSTVNDIKIHVKISESKKYRYFKNQQWQVGNDRLIDSHTIFNKNGVKVYFKTP